MSEERVPYGNEGEQWKADAAEVAGIIDKLNITNTSFAKELGISDRALRGYLSGAEPVPRLVLLASRQLGATLQPNREIFLQVHWKKAGLTVKRDDKFEMLVIDGKVTFEHNGEPVFSGTLPELESDGLVSVHKSYSAGRFRFSPTAIVQGSSL